jgi:hypothetical protein
MSMGMAVVTVLVLAVAFGLLSQDSSNPSASEPFPTVGSSAPSDGGVFPTDDGFPTDNAPTVAESPGSTPGDLTARSAAVRLCRAELPSALATARLATVTTDSDALRATTTNLEQAIAALADAAEGERRWAPALRSGRAAVAQWTYAVRAAPQEFGYQRGRAAGIKQAERMQRQLAAVGIRDCRS